MRYLFLTRGSAYYPNLCKDYHGAGAYNWPKAMEGEVRLWGELQRTKEQLLDYDIIHINLAADDVGLAAELAPLLKGSHVKLVCNLDYSINYMDRSVHVHELMADLQACTAAFGVEPAQANLAHYIMQITRQQKKVMLLPHPIDLEWMKHQWRDYEHRDRALAFHFHKYDGHLDLPWLLTYGLDVDEKIILGYTNTEFDVKEIPGFTLYPFAPFETYVRALSRCILGLEYRTHKAASRFIMEAASLGVPVVSTTDSFMGMMLYPELCHPVEDFGALQASLSRLAQDEEWRLSLAAEGMERITKYDFKNSKKNMERLLDAV